MKRNKYIWMTSVENSLQVSVSMNDRRSPSTFFFFLMDAHIHTHIWCDKGSMRSHGGFCDFTTGCCETI